MRNVLVVGLVLCACATVVHGQPPGAPGAAPAMPAPSPAHDFLSGSPEITFLLSLPGLLGRPFTFLVVFLFIGLVFTRLAMRIVLPRMGDAHYAGTLDPALVRKLAVANLVVWAVALLAASEAAGLRWFGPLVEGVFGLAGTVIGGLFLVVAAASIAYAISPRGRDFVLGLMGWYYLRYRPARPTMDQELDLGAGLRGRIVSTDFLHSVVQTADGQQYIIPNARLMKTYYNWGWEDPASPPPDVPSPPPAPPPVDQPGEAGQGS